MSVDEMVGFTVRVTKPEHERLSDLAKREHRSLAAQARLMVVTRLDEIEADEPLERSAA